MRDVRPWLAAQVGIPEWPVWPCGHDLGLLAGVAFTSFIGQYTLNRSFQLLAASHASAVNTLQASAAAALALVLAGLHGGGLIQCVDDELRAQHRAALRVALVLLCQAVDRAASF